MSAWPGGPSQYLGMADRVQRGGGYAPPRAYSSDVIMPCLSTFLLPGVMLSRKEFFQMVDTEPSHAEPVPVLAQATAEAAAAPASRRLPKKHLLRRRPAHRHRRRGGSCSYHPHLHQLQLRRLLHRWLCKAACRSHCHQLPHSTCPGGSAASRSPPSQLAPPLAKAPASLAAALSWMARLWASLRWRPDQMETSAPPQAAGQ